MRSHLLALVLVGAASAHGGPPPGWKPPGPPPTAEVLRADVEIRAHDGMICRLKVAPDGTRVASGSFDKTVRVSSWPDGEKLWKVAVPGRGRGAIAWAPDGHTLAGGLGDGSVIIWDAATGAPLRRMGQHAEAVSGVAFAPDGKSLASISVDGIVKCWDLATGAERWSGVGGMGTCDVGYAPDGGAVVTGTPCPTNAFGVFDAATGKGRIPWKLDGCGLDNFGTQLAFLDGSAFVFAGEPQRRAIASGASEWPESQVLEDMGYNEVVGLAVIPGQSLLASVGSADLLQLRDAGTGVVTRTATLAFAGTGCRIVQVAFTPDGNWALFGAQDGRIYGVKTPRLFKSEAR